MRLAVTAETRPNSFWEGLAWLKTVTGLFTDVPGVLVACQQGETEGRLAGPQSAWEHGAGKGPPASAEPGLTRALCSAHPWASVLPCGPFWCRA